MRPCSDGSVAMSTDVRNYDFNGGGGGGVLRACYDITLCCVRDIVVVPFRFFSGWRGVGSHPHDSDRWHGPVQAHGTGSSLLAVVPGGAVVVSVR